MKGISANQLQQLRQGNTKVFEAIFNRYWDRLFNAAYTRIHDDQQAQDIVQEVFIKVWDHRSTLHLQPEYLEFYLLKAVKNRVINYYHSEKVKESLLNEQLDRIEQLSNGELGTLIYQMQAFLHAQIETLPDTMRSVYALKDQEYSVQEIARNLNLAEQTVRNNITEAQQRLRKAIKQKFHSEYAFLFFVLIYLFTKS